MTNLDHYQQKRCHGNGLVPGPSAGEPGLEGMRYTGNLARSRTAFPGGQRQRYFVDQRLKTEMLGPGQCLSPVREPKGSLPVPTPNVVAPLFA